MSVLMNHAGYGIVSLREFSNLSLADRFLHIGRSYHFQYKMVKNERRNVETTECDAIFTALICCLQ